MSKDNIGKLERVSLREIWKHEARNFTQWLAENIAVLNEALDLNLVNADYEQPAGSFSVDLVAEYEDGGGTVIIENQLEKSNHDHLGKVITYLTAMNANTAIWVVAEPRPEHAAAIAWLNEASNVNFYFVKVEAVRISGSLPAPLFTLIVGPSEETKEIGQAKKGVAERHILRRRWWTTLIDRSVKVTKLHAHISPSDLNWISVTSGVRGLSFNYVVNENQCGAELYIDRGKGAEDENKKIFDQLISEKEKIERAVGEVLSWERLDHRRAARIRINCDLGGYRSPEDKWPSIQDKIIVAMDRLEKALHPYLSRFKDA